MNSRSAAAAGAAVVLAPGLIGLSLAMGSGHDGVGPTQSNGTFTCRASALRITGEGPLAELEIEPFVANDPNDPCVAEPDAGVINPPFALPGDLGTVQVLYAATDDQADGAAGGTAEAGVARVVLTLGPLPTIQADVLTSEAAVSCVNGQPQLASSSHVVRLQVGEDVIELPPDGAHEHVEIPLPPDAPIVLHVNHQETNAVDGGEERVQQALFLDTPLADVVIAESVVDYHGNPCEPGPTPTETGSPTPTPTETGSPTPTPTETGSPTPTPTPTGTGSPSPRPHHPDGFMTGGGRFGSTETTGSSKHGMVIPCTTGARPGPNLQVNWPSGSFHLRELTAVRCTDEPGYGPENPDSPFDTIEGTGTGTCRDKQSGNRGEAEIRFRFTDQGEPGRNRDTASVVVEGTCSWASSGTLTPGGNHQAHARHPGGGGPAKSGPSSKG